jgi:hypothetical protein
LQFLLLRCLMTCHLVPVLTVLRPSSWHRNNYSFAFDSSKGAMLLAIIMYVGRRCDGFGFVFKFFKF